jgi:hypothetical protein
MSWTDQELDDLAKKANGELNFAYSPSYFQEVEALFPQKKASSAIIFLGTGITVVAVIVSLLFIDVQSNLFSAVKTMDSLSGEFLVGIKMETKDQRPNMEDRIQYFMSQDSGLGDSGPKTENRIQDFRIQDSGLEIFITDAHLNEGSRSLESSNLRSAEVDKSTEVSAELSLFSEVSKKLENAPKNQVPVSAILATLVLHDFDFTQVVDGRFSQFPSRKKGTLFYYQVGVTMGQAIVENQGEHTKSLDLGVGLIYRCGYWSLRAGAALEYQSLNLTLAERSKHYGFSSDEYSNNLLYREFYNLNIPLTAQFHSGKHQMQAGVIFNYLLSSKMNYSFYYNGVMERNETVYGQNKGLTAFGAQATFGYGLEIRSNWTVGANLKWQMTNQVDKKMVEGSAIKPLSGQVFVRKIFKKR